MKNNQVFRPASRAGFYKIELIMHHEVVRALKWLYAHESGYKERRSLRQLCEHALCVYADTALLGKSFGQFQDDALIRRKPAYEKMDARALLINEIADVIEWGGYSKRRHGRNRAAAAAATALVAKRRAGEAFSWTKAINKPAQLCT